jgi:hypothetical protein
MDGQDETAGLRFQSLDTYAHIGSPRGQRPTPSEEILMRDHPPALRNLLIWAPTSVRICRAPATSPSLLPRPETFQFVLDLAGAPYDLKPSPVRWKQMAVTNLGKTFIN